MCARPAAWSVSARIPWYATACGRVSMPSNSTTNSWLFPPQTREVQFDEKWSFVAKKEKHCDRTDPDDDQCGDCWDHVALDAEHRLVVSAIVGRRTEDEASRRDRHERGHDGARRSAPSRQAPWRPGPVAPFDADADGDGHDEVGEVAVFRAPRTR